MPHGNYFIFYKIDEEQHTVEILRFWHAAQNRQQPRLKEESPAYAKEIEIRRQQLATGEGAVIPGDEALLQQTQAQQ